MSDQAHSGELLQSEEAIIRHFVPLAAAAAGAFALQDDCALLAPPAGCELVLKTDPIAEGVHFLVGEEPQDIGWKALAVNVSDLAAKGAAPAHYLLALSFPTAPRLSWVQGFVEGLRTAQERFGCHLIGGDTDRRPGPVTIAITLIGTVPQGRMVRRGTARAGDSLVVSGTLGDAALGLQLLRDPRRVGAWGLSADMVAHLKHRYRRPQPRLALAGALREHASAAMDLSDGLAKDLARLCRASGCGAHVQMADLPLSASAASAVAADRSQYQAVLAGGDDYEILASVPPQREAAFRRAAAAADIEVTRIGSLTLGSGISIEADDGHRFELARSGWDHFAKRPPGPDRG